MILKVLIYSIFFSIPLFFSCQILAVTESDLDLYCLKLSYPQIKKIIKSGPSVFLELENGQNIAYDKHKQRYNSPLDADLRESMAQIYPLEPVRPQTPQGYAPGRKRPYDFFEAIYGSNKAEAQSRLVVNKFLSSSLALNRNASLAFKKAGQALIDLAKDKNYREYLKPEGAFYWRGIAGENVPSAHSFGIAIDMGIKKSPYWRWSRLRPHPAQQTYPGEIVRYMEDNGFIWGGKWHEYDIMHYEYRPELICKSKMMGLVEDGKKGKFAGVRLKHQ